MSKLFVKVCGITRQQDAACAAELGATALGFVFWPSSPRYINPEKARAIVEQQPSDVLKVGVFVDEPVERVARMMETVGLDAAQLHGQESVEYCRQLMVRLSAVARVTHASSGETRRSLGEGGKADPTSGPRLRRTVIKAVGVKDNRAITIDEFDPDVLILLDAYDPDRFGGTGRTVNWDVAREVALSRHTILAGGLNPGNIALAIRTVQPYGVDISSGVESAPGVKDHDQLKTLFEALHA